MPSRQFAHLRQQSLERLRAMIPADVPLTAMLADERGFVASGPTAAISGRFEVVASYIDGFVRGWQAHGYVTVTPREQG